MKMHSPIFARTCTHKYAQIRTNTLKTTQVLANLHEYCIVQISVTLPTFIHTYANLCKNVLTFAHLSVQAASDLSEPVVSPLGEPVLTDESVKKAKNTEGVQQRVNPSKRIRLNPKLQSKNNRL
jgi:hypothetical protein